MGKPFWPIDGDGASALNAHLTSCDRGGANERAVGGGRMRRQEPRSQAGLSLARERQASRRRAAPRPD